MAHKNQFQFSKFVLRVMKETLTAVSSFQNSFFKSGSGVLGPVSWALLLQWTFDFRCSTNDVCTSPVCVIFILRRNWARCHVIFTALQPRVVPSSQRPIVLSARFRGSCCRRSLPVNSFFWPTVSRVLACVRWFLLYLAGRAKCTLCLAFKRCNFRSS